MQPLRNLGDYIRDQRRASEVSLRQLAAAAGVSNPYLSQIERGLRKPSADILQQIAKGLRVSAEALYVQAGILDERVGGAEVPAAIHADSGLSDRQKQVLLEIYDSFCQENAAPAAPVRPPVAAEAPPPPAAATTSVPMPVLTPQPVPMAKKATKKAAKAPAKAAAARAKPATAPAQPATPATPAKTPARAAKETKAAKATKATRGTPLIGREAPSPANSRPATEAPSPPD